MAQALVRLMPALLTAAAAVAALWVTMWLLTRWLRRWAPGHHVARLLRRLLEVVAVVVVALIALRGSGLGAPSITWPEVSDWVMDPGLHILFIFVGAYLLVRVTDVLTAYLQGVLAAADASGHPPGWHDTAERRKRIETLGRLLRGSATVVIAGMAGLMALREVNIDITPILTGAGVAGVAIGFGAQTVVKDILAGAFLILENQIRLGDVITINGKTGLVETLKLRIVALRGSDGALYIFHNGAISEYTNLTKDYSYAVLDLSLPYQQDLEKVTAVLRHIGEELAQDPEYAGKILAPLEVVGIETLAGAAVSLRARIRTVPMEQWAVDRELRRRVKERFSQEKIALA